MNRPRWTTVTQLWAVLERVRQWRAAGADDRQLTRLIREEA